VIDIIRHQLPICFGKILPVADGKRAYDVVDDHQLSVGILQWFKFTFWPVWGFIETVVIYFLMGCGHTHTHVHVLQLRRNMATGKSGL